MLHTLPSMLKTGGTLAAADVASCLALTPPFRALPPAARAEVADGLCLRFHRGERLVSEGEPCEMVLVVLRGLVSVKAGAAPVGLVGPGELIGEIGVLRDIPRSASADALTDGDMLALPAEVFLALGEAHAAFALDLARMLAGRLLAANRRIAAETHDPWRLLVLGPDPAAAVRLAAGLARALRASAGAPTALTLAPSAETLPALLGLPPGGSLLKHPDGYDVLAHRPASALDVHLHLLGDELRQGWLYAVIAATELHPGLLDGAHAIIRAEGAEIPDPPPGVLLLDAGDEPDLDALVDAMGRTERVSVYVPRRATDGRDAGPEVEATLAALARCYGGATVSASQGVWRSDVHGLVPDDLQVVSSWTDHRTLVATIDEVIEHVLGLKASLQQEAMAVEAGGRFMVL